MNSIKTLIVSLLISAICIFLGAYLINNFISPGAVSLSGTPYMAALKVAGVLALVNTFIRPILKMLTAPINFVTLGLFAIVLNALMLMLVDYFLVDFSLSSEGGFTLNSFMWAAILSVVISFLTGIGERVLGVRNK